MRWECDLSGIMSISCRLRRSHLNIVEFVLELMKNKIKIVDFTRLVSWPVTALLCVDNSFSLFLMMVLII